MSASCARGEADNPDARTLPVVCVVIPCHNHADFVAKAIDSVAIQDYPDLMTVVVDDGSTDGSYDVIRECLAEEIEVPRPPESIFSDDIEITGGIVDSKMPLYIIKRPEGSGPSTARNFGLRFGSFIGIILQIGLEQEKFCDLGKISFKTCLL